MKEKQLIIYDSIIIYIDRYIYESDEMFYFRVNYIYNNLNNNLNKNKEKVIGDSLIEMNMKFLNCSY
jgi:hypothetical protein